MSGANDSLNIGNESSVHLGVIILAAGRSERMGSLKPLLRLNGRTLLEHILENPFLSRPQIYPRIVFGHRAETIRQQLVFTIPYSDNPHFERGRTTSIQCGLRAMPSSIRGVFLWPVDCPLVPVEVFERICLQFQGTESICIPSYRQRNGHPPLIGAAYFPEILAMSEDQSLRDLYRNHPEKVITIEVDTETVLHNLNTPEQFEAVRKQVEPSLE